MVRLSCVVLIAACGAACSEGEDTLVMANVLELRLSEEHPPLSQALGTGGSTERATAGLQAGSNSSRSQRPTANAGSAAPVGTGDDTTGDDTTGNDTTDNDRAGADAAGHQTGGQLTEGQPTANLPERDNNSDTRRANPAPGPEIDIRPARPEPESATKPPMTKIESFRTVTMKAGQTLYGLCQTHLGRGNAWREVAKLNGWSESQVSRLPEGQVVKLPTR